jgi:hypothetical protein
MDYFLIRKIFDEKIKKRKRKIRKEKKKKRSKKRKREKKRLTIYSYILRIYSHILNQKEKERNPNPKFFINFLSIFAEYYARCMVIVLTTQT